MWCPRASQKFNSRFGDSGAGGIISYIFLSRGQGVKTLSKKGTIGENSGRPLAQVGVPRSDAGEDDLVRARPQLLPVLPSLLLHRLGLQLEGGAEKVSEVAQEVHAVVGQRAGHHLGDVLEGKIKK